MVSGLTSSTCIVGSGITSPRGCGTPTNRGRKAQRGERRVRREVASELELESSRATGYGLGLGMGMGRTLGHHMCHLRRGIANVDLAHLVRVRGRVRVRVDGLGVLGWG